MSEVTSSTTSRQLRQLRALMAPLARNRGSVIDDERLLLLARAICDALLHEDAEGGLLRHELAASVPAGLAELLDARIDVFCELGLLQTYTVLATLIRPAQLLLETAHGAT